MAISDILTDTRDSEGQKSVFNRLVLSKQLFLRKNDKSPTLIHQLSGITIDATPDLLEFLNQFKEPIEPQSLNERFSLADLQSTIARFIDIRFLVPETEDEENQWLDQEIDTISKKQIFQTGYFLTYYPNSEGFLAREFTDLMEERYDYLLTRGFPALKQKVLILLCSNRKEFKLFWGSARLSEWPRSFVTKGRILVIDLQRIIKTDRQGESFLWGMTHELVHVFLSQLTWQSPVWLEEGLCEYFSRFYDPKQFRELAKQKRLFSFQEIEIFAKHSLLDLDDSPVEENICYRQSHSFVAYLAGFLGDKKLIEFVRGTELGENFNFRLNKCLGGSLDCLEKKWLINSGLTSFKTSKSNDVYRKLKPSKNLRLIKNGKEVLIYNAFYGQSLIISSDFLELLAFLKEGKTLRDIAAQYEIPGLDQIMVDLHEKGLILYDHQIEDNLNYRRFHRHSVQSGALINKLRLNVSTLCNMNCTYCYVEQEQSKNGHMSWPIAKKALVDFLKLQKRHGHDHALIRFFGGEPLLNWPVIESTFEYVDGLRDGIQVDYILNTNGTIVSESIAEELAKRKVSIAISIDGVGIVHDQCRKFCSGSGTFKTIDKNLDFFIKYGCLVSVETTLGDHNFDHLKELIDYLACKADKSIQPMALSLQSMCMVPHRKLDSKPLKLRLKKIIEAINYARQHKISTESGMISFPFNSFLGRRTKGVYCLAMGEEMCVFPNGDIYPCGALKLKLGNIDNIERAFKSEAYLKLVERVAGNIPACQGCDIEAFCAGGCAADAMATHGGIFYPTHNCIIERAFFRARLKNDMLDGIN